MSYYPGQQQPPQTNQYGQYNQQPPPSAGFPGTGMPQGGMPGMPPPSYNNQQQFPPQPGQFNQPQMPAGFGSPGAPQPGGAHGGAPAAPKANVQFFSIQGGGTPTPSSSQMAAPPSTIGNSPGSMMGSPGGAPFGGGGGPPTNGGIMAGGMPPPGSVAAAPSSFYAPSAGPGGMPAPMTGAPGYSMSGAPGQDMSGYNNMQPGMSAMGGMSGGNPLGASMERNIPAGMAGNTSASDLGLQGSPMSTLPSLAETDLSIICDPKFLKCTVGKLHISQSASNNSRIPLGLIVKPMADDVDTKNNDIDVVDFGGTGIVRCKRCRTYVNPYVAWADNGRRWRCNICGMLNDVPTTYFSHLDAAGHRRDRDQRPELCRASVEFVAPGDYMVRPPQPPVYMFVIDVSSQSIQSGMLTHCVSAIKQSLDSLPGIPRTQIGFITFDSSIHFYNLKASLNAPQMLVVSDFSGDIVLPLPEDLLVNLQDSRKIVEQLLDLLPSMFANTVVNVSCTGPALLAAKQVITHIGGKMLLFQSSLPTLGEGCLKVRDNPRMLGTDKEHLFLAIEDNWYKRNPIEFSRLQICVDTFLFSAQYTDLSTLANLSKTTAGSTYYYPGFYSKTDGVRFEKDLVRVLTRATAFEAVMRVRATKGIKITTFYGNHYVRGQDLLALPNCTADSTFALDIAYDEPSLIAQVITVQAALLYTSSCGERRIRIHTMVLPVVQSIPDILETVDIDAVVNIVLKQAVEIAQKNGFENARNRVHQLAVEMLRGSRPVVGGGMGGYPGYGAPQAVQQAASADTIPPALQLVPLYAMSIQKSLALRGGADVRMDDRAYYHSLAHNMDTEDSKSFVYPCLFSLHDMSDDVGLPSTDPEEELSQGVLLAGPFNIKLPNILNLTQERFITQGMFLLENGVDMYLWVGRSVAPNLVLELFGVCSLEQVDPSTLQLSGDDSDPRSFASRVSAVVLALRQRRQARYMKLNIIREGDGPAEAHLARYYVEDRAPFPGGQMAYAEYHNFITRQVGGGGGGMN